MNHPKFFKRTLLQKQLSFNGNLIDFERAIKYCDEIKISKISFNHFNFEATLSLGIFKPNLNPISINIIVTEKIDQTCDILITSNYRNEHYVIATIFITVICSIIANGEYLNAIYCIPIWVLSQFWFFKVYRIQELAITDNLSKKLWMFEEHFLT